MDSGDVLTTIDIYIAGFINGSVQNGEGLRDVIFFSGCDHGCKGCQNREYQDINAGTVLSISEVLNMLQDTAIIDGITISGGDPFKQPDALYHLCKEYKNRFPAKTIWCYTGYTVEELRERGEREDVCINKSLELIDVLVDGRYIEELNPTKNDGALIKLTESLDTDRVLRYADLSTKFKREHYKELILRYTGSVNQRIIRLNS